MVFLTEINSAVLLAAFSINLGLSIYIYFNNRKNLANLSFSLLLFVISLWTLSFFAFTQARDLVWVLFWRRMTPVGSSLIASFFLYFTLVFPRREKPLPGWQALAVLVPGLVFSFISLFSGLMIKGIVVNDPAVPFLGIPIFGPLYPAFAFYFIAFFGAGVVNLFYKYFRAEGRDRLQIWYMLFGIVLSGVVGIFVSLLLPIWGIGQLFTAGPLFTLFLACFVTYAIVRHNLLNIEDFLSRGIVFLAVVAAVVLTLAALFKQTGVFLLPGYTIIANLTLGGIVILQNPKGAINRSFSLLVFFIALWSFSNFLSDSAAVYAEALLWNRMVYAVSSILAGFSVLFAFYFPEGKAHLDRNRLNLIMLPGIVLAAVALFTGLIVKEIHFVPWGTAINYGPLFFVHSAYLVLYLGYTIYALAAKYFKYQGIFKMQIRYVFLGGTVSIVLSVFTNVVMPMLGHFRFTSIGPSFMLVLVAFTSYAIVRHRLMSIEIIIQRSAIYAIATVLTMSLYALAVLVSEIYLRQILGYTSLLVTAFAAMVIAVAYQPLVKGFQNFTDRIFFRGRYDYQKTLRKISHEIASVIKLEELTRLIVSSFIETMKVSEISFLLLEKEREHFRSVPLAIPRYKRIEIDVSSPIVSWLLTNKDILVREEIEDEIGRRETPGLEEVRDAMERLGIPIWVPIVSKAELIGIIALGNKLSGDIFSSEDLVLLTTLANQTAVALDNARLYDAVLSMKNYSEEILQSMTNGVLTTDNRGRVITYNYMAERITGKKLNEVMGKTCEEIWGKRGAITLAVEKTLADRPLTNFETGIASPERGLVPVSFSSTVLRDGQGKKMGALLSIQDLSEMKELEDKIRRVDKLTALATMAAGMAHEIKNPLSSMKVFSQLLPLKIDDPEYRKKLGEILPREIDRIDRIVESLLGFARSTTPTFEKMKIEEVLEENLKYFEDKANNAGVKIKKSYADLPAIEVDRGQISQVFSNLILNAIQAMPEGGELSVETLPGKKVDEVLQNIKVRVSDSGHGITEEMQKKLFDPFFTTKYGGTGLGLTITHSIVDGHKGFIDVHSKLGKGTTFTVTLPVNQGLI
jgi:PAS domain S-box-containing protein